MRLSDSQQWHDKTKHRLIRFPGCNGLNTSRFTTETWKYSDKSLLTDYLHCPQGFNQQQTNSFRLQPLTSNSLMWKEWNTWALCVPNCIKTNIAAGFSHLALSALNRDITHYNYSLSFFFFFKQKTQWLLYFSWHILLDLPCPSCMLRKRNTEDVKWPITVSPGFLCPKSKIM